MSISQHIASIRSRASHQNRLSESEQTESRLQQDNELSAETLSKLSVASQEEEYDPNSNSDNSRRQSSTRESERKPPIVFSSLGVIDSVQDIEMNLDEELHQVNVLNKLESKWVELSRNLDATLAHLQECSNQVTESSTTCLESLKDSVEDTCDKIDAELKAFYHLMTKCDELTTKLSMATSFREEIRTLRKTVETLEQLYKNKPPRPTPRELVAPSSVSQVQQAQ